MLKIINENEILPDYYEQYPGKPAPADIYGGSWLSLFDNEGVFFRTPGGNASSFGAGIQTDVVRNVTGVSNYIQSRTMATAGVFTHATVNAPDWKTGDIRAYGRSVTFNLSNVVPTGPEFRPVNRTYRIWERIKS